MANWGRDKRLVPVERFIGIAPMVQSPQWAAAGNTRPPREGTEKGDGSLPFFEYESPRRYVFTAIDRVSRSVKVGARLKEILTWDGEAMLACEKGANPALIMVAPGLTVTLGDCVWSPVAITPLFVSTAQARC